MPGCYDNCKFLEPRKGYQCGDIECELLGWLTPYWGEEEGDSDCDLYEGEEA